MICLKNRTFAVSQTTNFRANKHDDMLWFAWKIVLLQYRKQHEIKDIDKKLSCDLLEKSYFCSIANNGIFTNKCANLLWFAWKIVLLQYRKQRIFVLSNKSLGCDLLEKSYFCSIANNTMTTPDCTCSVVICLKNRTFAVSQTTTAKS